MKVKMDRLIEMNEEYRDLVGDKVLSHISDPNDSSDNKQYRFAFQGAGVVIGIDEALAVMGDLLTKARNGYAWEGTPIPEFRKTWRL